MHTDAVDAVDAGLMIELCKINSSTTQGPSHHANGAIKVTNYTQIREENRG